eukprot:225504_1
MDLTGDELNGCVLPPRSTGTKPKGALILKIEYFEPHPLHVDTLDESIWAYVEWKGQTEGEGLWFNPQLAELSPRRRPTTALHPINVTRSQFKLYLEDADVLCLNITSEDRSHSIGFAVIRLSSLLAEPLSTGSYPILTTKEDILGSVHVSMAVLYSLGESGKWPPKGKALRALMSAPPAPTLLQPEIQEGESGPEGRKNHETDELSNKSSSNSHHEPKQEPVEVNTERHKSGEVSDSEKNTRAHTENPD